MAASPRRPPPASFAALWIALSMLLVARAPTTRHADSTPSCSSSRPRSKRRQIGGTATSATDAPEEEDGNPTVVILDSAASYHAAADRRWLSGFDAAAPAGRDAVHRTRDGTELHAAGAGTLANEKFLLPDVLHIPGLLAGTILVSVQLLARSGCHVMFGDSQCLVMDRTAGKLVGQGRLHQDGLYRLDFLKVPPHAADAVPAQGTDTNVEV